MNSDDPAGPSDRIVSKKDRSRQAWEQKKQLKNKWLQGAKLTEGRGGSAKPHSTARELMYSDPHEIDLDPESGLEEEQGGSSIDGKPALSRLAKSLGLSSHNLKIPLILHFASTVTSLMEHALSGGDIAGLHPAVPHSSVEESSVTKYLGGISDSFIAEVGACIGERYAGATVDADSKMKKRLRHRASVRNFWSKDCVVHLLLRTLHMALTGHIHISSLKASGAGSGTSAKQNRAGADAAEVLDLTSEDDKAGTAGTAGTNKLPAGTVKKSMPAPVGTAVNVVGDPSEMISSCLLQMQTILVDGKPEGGWSSEGLKGLREGVLDKLNFSQQKVQALAVFMDFILLRQSKRENPSAPEQQESPAPLPESTRGEDKGVGSVDVGGAVLQGPSSLPAVKKNKAESAAMISSGNDCEAGNSPRSRPPPRREDVLDVMRKLYKGMSLAALAEWETSLVSHFGLPSFSFLGLPGPTLLSAIAHDEDVQSILSGHFQASSLVSSTAIKSTSLQRDEMCDHIMSQPIMAAGEQAVLQQDVLDIAAQAVRAIQWDAGPNESSVTSSNREALELLAVERSLKGHYGVPRVELLGFGPVQHIKDMCSSQLQKELPLFADQSNRSTDIDQRTGGQPSLSSLNHVVTGALISAHALTSASLSADAAVQRGALSPPLYADRATALKALSKVPPLTDLHHGSQWSVMFEQSLGRLEDFLRREAAEAACAGVAALQLPPGSAPDALMMPHGRLIKLDPTIATLDHFIESVSKGDAPGAVHCLLSSVAVNGSIRGAPLQLLQHHMAVCMGAWVAATSLMEQQELLPPSGKLEAGDRHEAAAGVSSLALAAPPDVTVQESHEAAAGVSSLALAAPPDVTVQESHEMSSMTVSFCCTMLQYMPVPLLTPLAERVILPSASQILGGSAACHRLLLKHACMPGMTAQRTQLQHLGITLGIDSWKSDFESMINSNIENPHQQQDHLLPTRSEQSQLNMPSSRNEQQPLSFDPPAADLAHNTHLMETQLLADATSNDVLSSKGHHSQPVNSVTSFQSFADKATSASGDPYNHIGSGDEVLCESVVQKIRREEFGLGDEESLGAAGKKLREVQNARMGRALQRLSQELYSKDSHFVLELIQNADDNSYGPGVTPTLHFEVSDSDIWIFNNEVGFSESNLRALCDVGRSTKSAGLGYIGQKGIGWKSVFRVTDCPEVHSNGFHVKFDLAADSHLGFILPTWIDHRGGGRTFHESVECERHLSSALIYQGSGNSHHGAEGGRVQSTMTQGTTTILPLKTLMQGQGGVVLRRRFEDIQPSLLLFLQRLRRISIRTCMSITAHNSNEGAPKGSIQTAGGKRAEDSQRLVKIMYRTELPHPRLPAGVTVVLLHNEGRAPSKWLVVRHEFQPCVLRGDVPVAKTQVCIALPLDYAAKSGAYPTAGTEHSSRKSSSSRPSEAVVQRSALPQQQVYAFLPLRSYGLKLIVQGDFVVPSSREAVDSDSPWNQALRAELPTVFIKALLACKKLDQDPAPLWSSQQCEDGISGPTHPIHSPQHQESFIDALDATMPALDLWLRCLPALGEAQGFFAPLPQMLATSLRATPCIPTESGSWVTPSQAAVCHSPSIRHLLKMSTSHAKPSSHQNTVPHPAASLLPKISSPDESSGHFKEKHAAVESSASFLMGGLCLVHPAAQALHENAALRSLLGVKEFTPQQLISMAKDVCTQGKLLGEIDLAWIAQLLVCIFEEAIHIPSELSEQQLPSDTSPAGLHASGSRARVTRDNDVMRALRQLPLLPLMGGSFGSAAGSNNVMAAYDSGRPFETGPIFLLPNNLRHNVGLADRTAHKGNVKGPRIGGEEQVPSSTSGVHQADLPHLLSVMGIHVTKDFTTRIRFLDPAILSASLCQSLRTQSTGSNSGCSPQSILILGLRELGVRDLTAEDMWHHHLLPELRSSQQASNTSLTVPSLSSTDVRRLCKYLAFPLAAALLSPSHSLHSTSSLHALESHMKAGLRGFASQQHRKIRDVASDRLKELIKADIPLIDSKGKLIHPRGSLSTHSDSRSLYCKVPILFPSELGNGFASELQASGASSNWAFLHSAYAEAGIEMGVPVDHMRWLLAELGVVDFPQPEMLIVRSDQHGQPAWPSEEAVNLMTDLSGIGAGPHKAVSTAFNNVQLGGSKLDSPAVQVQDWHCPALCDQISCLLKEAGMKDNTPLGKRSRIDKSSGQTSSTLLRNPRPHHALKVLARTMSQHWQLFEQAMHAQVLVQASVLNDAQATSRGVQLSTKRGSGANTELSYEVQPQAGSALPAKRLPSTLCLFLKDTAWLPSSRGNLSKPSSLYLGTTDIKQLMSDKVTYLDVVSTLSALAMSTAGSVESSLLEDCADGAVCHMAKDLGVITTVDVACVLRALREWSMISSDRSCCLYRTQAIDIYSRLSQLMLRGQGGADINNQVCEAIRSEPLIWLPNAWSAEPPCDVTHPAEGKRVKSAVCASVSDSRKEQRKKYQAKDDDKEQLPGRFYSVHQLVWRDPSALDSPSSTASFGDSTGAYKHLGILNWLHCKRKMKNRPDRKAEDSTHSANPADLLSATTMESGCKFPRALSHFYPPSLERFFLDQLRIDDSSINVCHLNPSAGQLDPMVCEEQEGEGYQHNGPRGSLPLISEQPTLLMLCEAMAAAQDVCRELSLEEDIHVWLEARSLVMSVFEFISKRLIDQQLPKESLVELSTFLTSTPCIPTVSIVPRLLAADMVLSGARSQQKQQSVLYDWTLGFACLGASLLLEDSAGDTVFSLCNGKPDSLRIAASSSDNMSISLVAAGRLQHGAFPSSPASVYSALGPEIVTSLLSLPSSENILWLLQRLGIQLLSSRLVRTVREDVNSAGDEHAALCQGTRAVFPLVQRYLLKVLSPEAYTLCSQSVESQLPNFRCSAVPFACPLAVEERLYLGSCEGSQDGDAGPDSSSCGVFCVTHRPAAVLLSSAKLLIASSDGGKEGSVATSLMDITTATSRELARFFWSAPTMRGTWGTLPLALRQGLIDMVHLGLLIVCPSLATTPSTLAGIGFGRISARHALESLAVSKGLPQLPLGIQPWTLPEPPLVAHVAPKSIPGPRPPPGNPPAAAAAVNPGQVWGGNLSDMDRQQLEVQHNDDMTKMTDQPYRGHDPMRNPVYATTNAVALDVQHGPYLSGVSPHQPQASPAPNTSAQIHASVSPASSQPFQGSYTSSAPRKPFSLPSASASASATVISMPVDVKTAMLPTAIATKLLATSQRLEKQQQRYGRQQDNAWSSEQRLQVGRWGEELAFYLLQEAVSEGRLDQLLPGIAAVCPALLDKRQEQPSVLWMNEREESGQPYDLAVVDKSGRAAARGQVIAYVEVKTSRAQHKDVFEISKGELAFAEREGKRYYVLRVWRHHGAAETAPARVQAFRDPVALWQQKKIAMCLMV
ncbi:hypothetical protein CEUSTIGMA_g3064.t1 [Chlamydomonas eustigma]|uniref:Uncharacterized protein n=1 Tax=Chlamydomonas eustigma TaxID=1157962 RepID=A0A250WYP0_9CHLO|nr:hypothetical protein CEUSTIGMA_g3064.t1 [Chlamydomonas eustigma]|eukprot:GAX75620.1 hypothetical protein CEUSTIGMA_g3064.t1 [Chlamydomonas eustigma]